jgi:hypothetical protein
MLGEGREGGAGAGGREDLNDHHVIGAEAAGGAEQQAERQVSGGLGDGASPIGHPDVPPCALDGVDVIKADGGRRPGVTTLGQSGRPKVGSFH